MNSVVALEFLLLLLNWNYLHAALISTLAAAVASSSTLYVELE
jgi:hypothetical protein